MKLIASLLFILSSFHALCQIDSSAIDLELNEVVISFSKNTDEFYSKPNHFIIDMIEDSTGILVLLKSRGKYRLEKINWNGSVNLSQELPFKSSNLSKDCLGNVYLSKETSFQRFDIDEGFIHFGENFSDFSYKSEIEPCVAYSGAQLVFKSLSDFNQTIYLWTFDYGNDSVQEIYQYTDSIVLKTNNEENQIVRNEGYSNHRRMGDIWHPELRILIDQQERKVFFNTISTQVPYAPMFSYKKNHYFFNFLNDSIYRFNENLEITFKTKSLIRTESQKSSSILMDQKTGQFYSINTKNSSIEKFNIEENRQGRIVNSQGVHSRKKFVYGNRLFFLGKDSRTDSFNKIMVEKL